MATLPPTMQRALEWIESGNSLGRLAAAGFGSVVLEFFIGLGRLVDAVVFFFERPIRTVITVATDLWAAIVGGPIPFLEDTAAATGPQLVDTFGFLSFPVAVGIALGSVFLLAQFLQERETGDFIPGVRDFPLIGRTEEGEDEDQ
jgi:hypothetical protein